MSEYATLVNKFLITLKHVYEQEGYRGKASLGKGSFDIGGGEIFQKLMPEIRDDENNCWRTLEFASELKLDGYIEFNKGASAFALTEKGYKKALEYETPLPMYSELNSLSLSELDTLRDDPKWLNNPSSKSYFKDYLEERTARASASAAQDSVKIAKKAKNISYCSLVVALLALVFSAIYTMSALDKPNEKAHSASSQK